ncbi:MAG: M1 family peptidase [Balneolaceae bacterium]|nr:MAG: M1 family peptidase [Balneolaceae bacterium]
MTSRTFFALMISLQTWLLACSNPATADIPVIVPLHEYENSILDSGGKLLEEQAALNIHFYDLDLNVNPADSTISGVVNTQAHVTGKTGRFAAHLDTVFTVSEVIYHKTDEADIPLGFYHENGLVVAKLPGVLDAGSHLSLSIHYSGRPRKAPNPPWEGGFTWERTRDGKPWIGVSCQVNGADIWWPVKDHPSDRPDSVSLRITVPEEVMAVSNGVLRSAVQHQPGTRTFHWVTNAPISNYAVSMNIGPYAEITRPFQSVSGEVFPIIFWALPENRERAEELMGQVVDHMRFFENLLGPYPFRHEKYGVAEAPFFGMEHQTIIAYGAGYEDDTVFDTGSGFDDLHHHELSHEWWGNFVTAYDWKDFWIHEGFGTYMQPLYAEHLHGKEQYRYFMKRIYERIENNMAIAPEESRTTREMFEGRDIYMKGAWVLHSLRKLIGDDDFFRSLRKMTYPDGLPVDTGDPETGKRPSVPSRYTDTDEFIAIAQEIAGRDLGWFFDAYLRYSTLPELQEQTHENGLILTWSVPSGRDFPMPVEVWDGEELQMVVPDGESVITVSRPEALRVDPHNKVLRAGMFQ